MNKNIILSVALVCSIAINLMVLWPINHPLIPQTKNFILSIIYRDSITTMFEDNMKLINGVLAICEKNNKSNITDAELGSAASEIATMIGYSHPLSDISDKKFINSKYSHLEEQRMPLDNSLGPDWAGTPIHQWMQLIYILRIKQADNPQAKIYPLAEEIILNTMPINTRKLHKHIAAMAWLDAQKTKEDQPQEIKK